MKIINPSFEIRHLHSRDDGIRLLREVEYYARISHRSEEAQTATSWERIIRSVVIEKGDWSVTEHEKVTVIMRVDRGVTHELVRHRIGSYTQESTRFVNYRKRVGEEGLEFLLPADYRPSADPENDIQIAYRKAEEHYMALIARGVRPQEARAVLPSGLASTIVVTFNLRNWRHFFMMRTTKETHPDFRRVTIPLLETFKERIPLLYDDLVPNQAQSISIAKPR